MNTCKRYLLSAVVVCALVNAAPADTEWYGEAALSPSGDWIAATEVAGKQRGGVWDWRTHRPVLAIKGFYSTAAASASFALDGKKLAYVLGGKVQIVELPGGKELPAPAIKRPESVALVAGDTNLLTYGEKRVVLWDLTDGKERAVWTVAAGDSRHVSPDRKTLVLLARDEKTLKLINLVRGTELPLPLLKGVQHVAYQPDGSRLVVNLEGTARSKGGQFVLLEAATGKELGRHTLESQDRDLVALSADGKTLAVVCLRDSAEIELWNTTTWQRERVWAETRGRVSHLVFSPDGRWLAFGVQPFNLQDAPRAPTLVALREVATGRERAVVSFPLSFADYYLDRVQFAEGGKVLMVRSNHEAVFADVGMLEQAMPVAGRHDGPVTAVAVSPDGQTLASAGVDRTICLWDAAKGSLRVTLLGHRGLVLALGFAPDGQTLASTSADGTVRLWDPATAKTRTVLKGHTGGVAALAFRKDGLLATGALDGTVKLWNIAKGEEQGSFRLLDKREVCALAFAPDGQDLAVSSGNAVEKYYTSSLSIYDVATRNARPAWKGPFAAGSLLWGHDGKTLYTAGRDGERVPIVQVWNVAKGQVEKQFPVGQQNELASSLAWEGTALAIGMGGKVQLWDPLAGTLRGQSLPLPGAALSIAPLSGGRLAIGSFDGSVVVWTVPQAKR